MRSRTPLALILMSLTSAGCLSVKSYVDPQLPKVTYADLLRRSDVRPIYLTLEFQTNGKPNAKGRSLALDRVTRTLETSKLFSYVAFTPADTLDRMDIVMNRR